MADLDLICEEPYKIGFIGSGNFIGFTIGSLIFVKFADDYGRKAGKPYH